jgi:hypothetical protein
LNKYSPIGINGNKIEEIARKFLQQHHEVRNIEVVRFENGIWSVHAEVHSSSGYGVRNLQVDDITGKIISVE